MEQTVTKNFILYTSCTLLNATYIMTHDLKG